jgi:hypothetical protein
MINPSVMACQENENKLFIEVELRIAEGSQEGPDRQTERARFSMPQTLA